VDHILITPVNSVYRRWKEAFPGGQVYGDMNRFSLAGSPVKHTIIWLDLSAVPAEDHRAAVTTLSKVSPMVVAMAPMPNDAQGIAVLKAGAEGYCHMLATPRQLIEIATVIEHGGFWVGPDLMKRIIGIRAIRDAPITPPDSLLEELTPRELMVAKEVGHGANNREIAESLNITERTVKAHLSVIFEKLCVRDRVQLALAINNISTDMPVANSS